MATDSERIEKFRQMLRLWRFNGDTYSWPIKLNAAMHLFCKEFGEELLDDLAWLEAQGKTLAEIAQPFYNPARPYRMIDFVIYSMRRNRRPLAAQRMAVVKLLTMAKSLKYGSELIDEFGNLVYDPVRAGEIAATMLDRPVASLAESQMVHRFCAMLWTYTESILFRVHDLTKEFHGPYPYDEGRKHYVVKEYLNLRPVEIWPDMPLLPSSTIKVYQQYKFPVRLRIEAHNRVYHDGGQLIPHLESWAVEVDGRRLSAAEVAESIAPVQRAITALTRHVETLGWHERAIKYAEMFWLRKKPLRDQRNRDWRLPASVREAIQQGSELERRRVPLSSEECERLAMLTI